MTSHRTLRYSVPANSVREFGFAIQPTDGYLILEDSDVSKRHVARRFKQQCHALSTEQDDSLNVVCTFLILRVHTWGRRAV